MYRISSVTVKITYLLSYLHVFFLKRIIVLLFYEWPIIFSFYFRSEMAYGGKGTVFSGTTPSAPPQYWDPSSDPPPPSYNQVHRKGLFHLFHQLTFKYSTVKKFIHEKDHINAMDILANKISVKYLTSNSNNFQRAKNDY